jgi:hypothetical protein
MEQTEFQKVLDAQLEWCKKTLGAKNVEYSRGGDKLYNFKVAARMENTTQEKALWGMLLKHWVSVRDTVFHEAPVPEGQCRDPLPSYLDEKIGDSINYLLLLRAMFEERRQLSELGTIVVGSEWDRAFVESRSGPTPIGKMWNETTRSYIDRQ